MPLRDLFVVALRALSRNVLRSGLTLLGIIMGVMTIVSVISVISGLNEYVATKVINLNPDVVIFTRFGIIRGRDEWIMALRRKPLTLREARLVESECRSCGAVGALSDVSAGIRAGKRRMARVHVTGYTANMAAMLNVDLAEGRFFSEAEEQHATPVAVLGADVKDELFPALDPVGRTVEVRGYPLRVIGLQARQGKVLGEARDNVVFVPLTFIKKVLTSDDGIDIAVRPRRGMQGLDEMQDEVRTLLRSYRKTTFLADDPFGIIGAEALKSLWRSISAGAFALMALVSLISLFAGAIVIANTMFVAVVERTLEIGTRRALGARRRDILRQFLLESALLAAAGGVVGVLLGALAAAAVSQFFPARVRPEFALLGVVVATLSGLAAGLVPSYAASRMTPVEALRHE